VRRLRQIALAGGLVSLAATAPGCGDNAAAGPDAAPPLCTGGYHVCGGFVRDADGRALILRGANLAGAHKRPPYFGFHQPADFARMRDEWNFDAVRFLISWAAVEPSDGVFDDSYLDAVAMRMQWAEDAGLLVVLDMHQDVYGEGFTSGGGNGAPGWSCDQSHYDAFEPASSWFLNYANDEVIACYDHLWTNDATRGKLVAAWGHVAARLAAEPAVIGFDALNEPFWGSYSVQDFEPDLLQPFYDEVVAAVRANAPGWVAFLEPASSRNLGVLTNLHTFNLPDVVYAPHAYDTGAEQGMGFSADRRQGYLDNVRLLAGEARGIDAALWIGEYGGYGDGIEEYMDAAYDGAAAVAAGNMLWSYDKGGSYSILRADGSENAALMASVVRPYPTRVAGDPVSWVYDDASGAFSLTLQPDPRITAPTVIALPPRLYPGGADVDCGGCSAEVTTGEVLLADLPATDQLTVTVTPR